MDVTIRPYVPEDETEWMRTYAIIMTTSHSWNDCIQERPQYAKHESDLLVAEVDGKIVGITDILYDNEPGDVCMVKDTRGGYVPILGRLPEYPGLCIGPRLLDAAVDAARNRGIARLEYWSQDRNAQRFYRRLGLREIGRHYRFRMKATKPLEEMLLQEAVGVEYVYAVCMPEDWPQVQKKFDLLKDHPHEPHLCIGFEVSDFERRYAGEPTA